MRLNKNNKKSATAIIISKIVVIIFSFFFAFVTFLRQISLRRFDMFFAISEAACVLLLFGLLFPKFYNTKIKAFYYKILFLIFAFISVFLYEFWIFNEGGGNWGYFWLNLAIKCGMGVFVFCMIKYIGKRFKGQKMQNKIDNKTKEGARRYIKHLSYFLYFYFGISGIFMPFVFFGGGGRLAALFGGTVLFDWNIVVNFVTLLIGLISTYKLSKFNRTALVVLAAIFIVGILTKTLFSLSIGMIKIPVFQIATLFGIIGGFRHIKNAR